MSEVTTVRYKLVGPHAGKTITLGKKFPFVNGILETGIVREDQKHQFDGLTRQLARAYNAHPEGSKSLVAAEAEWAANPLNKNGGKNATKQVLPTGKAKADGKAAKGTGSNGAEEGTEGHGAEGEDNLGAGEGEGDDTPEEMTLADALNKLDPEDDSHWTKSGLPDLNTLSEWMGHKVTRPEIAEVHEGFNREVAAAAENE